MIIYKYNSYYEIDDINQADEIYTKIDQVFSSYNWKTRTRYGRLFLQIGSTIRIPSTVDEDFLLEIFKGYHIINYETEQKRQVNFYNMRNSPRNEMQESAIEFLQGPEKHKVLSLNTNAGKTYITINAISRMKTNAIILVDTISLGEQWVEEIKKHTDLKTVQIIDAAQIENQTVEDANIFVITQQSVNSLMLKNYELLNNFIEEKQIDIKVFDESHLRFQNMVFINNMFNTAKTIYLTATFDRNYKEIKQWKQVFSGVDKMIKKTIERYREIHLVRFTSGPTPTEHEVNYVVGLQGASSTLWGKYLIRKEKKLRRKILAPIIEKIIENYGIKPLKSKPLCIIVPMNEMAYDLEKYFSKKGYSTSVYNSDENKTRTTEEIFNHNIIFTNNSMFAKGIDIPKLKYLINFTSVTSVISLEQVVGRLRGSESENDNKIYIDCVDASFGDSFIKQQKIRRRYYKKITTDEELLKEKNVFYIEG